MCGCAHATTCQLSAAAARSAQHGAQPERQGECHMHEGYVLLKRDFFYSQLSCSLAVFCHLAGTERVFGLKLLVLKSVQMSNTWFTSGHPLVCFTLDLLISSLVKTT